MEKKCERPLEITNRLRKFAIREMRFDRVHELVYITPPIHPPITLPPPHYTPKRGRGYSGLNCVMLNRERNEKNNGNDYIGKQGNFLFRNFTKRDDDDEARG